MFEKLRDMAGLGPDPNAPASNPGIDDPVARETEWGPARKGGASFRTRNLVREGPDRLVFKPTRQYTFVSLVFFLIGLALVLAFFSCRYNPGGLMKDGDEYVLLLTGITLVAAGTLVLYLSRIPAVFDKSRGAYWKSRANPARAEGPKALKDFTGFGSIHALQLISKRYRDPEAPQKIHTSYELNLVCSDASRVNVVDHNDLAALRRDAQSLAEFLQKPLWDAS